ncbi:MAG TPA: inositol-3-phosphate synthase [Candidatus Dormibacteraeota bacterium]|nr:inositol-3-phosphate synthase [Candidatus Dormibacteraeota bacterium]
METDTTNAAERVIRRFGGQSALAQLLGRTQSTVEHWASTGWIPAQWHQPLMSLARSRGVALEARDFVESQAHVIEPATGRLGVLIVGLGAVASTFIAGVELIRRGAAQPIGSLTQMGSIRLGKRTEGRSPLIRDFVPLAGLDQLVFGAWDPISDNAYEAAIKCGVLDRHAHIEPIAGELREVEPMPAVFDRNYVRRLEGSNVKSGANKRELAEALRRDIREFRDAYACDRLVMIWCASTEIFIEETPIHADIASLEAAMEANDPNVAPSMLYAYAALMEGVPFINGAPNLTVDVPAMVALANQQGVPVCGKDFKTGQTLIKTVLAPMLKARMLGLRGWYSTNILGNRDGEVLDDPDSFKTKEVSKLGVLEYILQPELYPDLYGDIYHKVRINYYPPRGDSKEGWDNLDIFGWLGYPMQIKVDFLCRDSILAAPLALDLVLFSDLAQRAGLRGIQEWLSFYFKSPQHAASVYPEHDLFIQQTKLKNTLRWLMGEEQITHLGMEYYQED